MFRRLIFALLTGLPILTISAGCGGPELNFRSHEKVATLASTVAATNLENALEEHFGTPNNLVAWGTLPIDFGELRGTVLTADGNSLRVKLDSEPDGLLTNIAAVIGTDNPSSRTATSYTPATHMLELVPMENAPPIAPGTAIRLVGHNLQFGRQQYMQHCMHCHGVTGDGKGPTVSTKLANHVFKPLPRDYRRGLFKFTSTKDGFLASRNDLARTIRQGLAGTYMPAFLLLEDRQVDAIVEYIRFLAMRGQVERQMLTHLQPLQQDADGQAPADLKALETELAVDGFAEAFADAASLVAENWTNAEDADNRVLPTIARVPDTASSRKKGRDLFVSTKINCAKCHGEGGRGNGGFLKDFQKNPETNEPYGEAGLHDAWHQIVIPRDLTSGIYRGGRRPLDVFRRVTVGVKATPMAGFGSVEEEDRWHIVNYVLSIPIDGAFFDEHGHQYHGGRDPHVGHDHSKPHSHAPTKTSSNSKSISTSGSDAKEPDSKDKK